MTDSNPPDAPAVAEAGETPILGPRHLTRAMILVVAVAFGLVFEVAARKIGWPREPKFNGSLLFPVAAGPFLVALLLLAVCSLLGTAILGRRWFMAGLMTASAGLMSWSIGGGRTTYLLLEADTAGIGSKVFLLLLVELIVFYAVIAGLWMAIWSRRPPAELPLPKDKAEARSAVTAILAQTALMAVFMLVLAVTMQKKQVMASVFISGVGATAIAEYFFADRVAGRWYWIAPLAVGVFGYIANYLSAPGLETGDLMGAFGPLGRALPLDYASAGCAGVLFGYWWMMPDEEDLATSAAQASEQKLADAADA